MLLDSITLTHTTPCIAEPGKIIVTGKPSHPLNEVLPYLATLPSVIGFNPETLSLTFRRPRGFMTIYSQQVSITQVKDVEEGFELLAALTEAINATWEERHALIPIQDRKRPSSHLDIYQLLPQTNCKQCGEATCLAFAVALLAQKRTLIECSALQEDPVYVDHRFTLEAML
jgi:ArsR family metal-binding transcriptional regulator